MLTSLQKRIFIFACLTAVMNFAFVNCGVFDPPQSSSSKEDVSTCPMAPAHLRAPATIDQVTELINALPKPLSIPCLIENLPTPLKVFAANSNFSAQPAEGADSPRIFIISGKLVLSVVPAGVGKDLLEYGQFINSTESVKAELEFPIEDTIPLTQPYDHIKSGTGTSCRFCHSSERSISGFGGDAFASAVVRPSFFQRQTAARLRTVAQNCNKATDPYRCEMLNSIFVRGKAQDADLP
jgi:hypothetical protein